MSEGIRKLSIIKRGLILFLLLGTSIMNGLADPTPVARIFRFGSGITSANVYRVEPDTLYSRKTGYGFEPGADLHESKKGNECAVVSSRPFLFSVKLPEGNYNVEVTLGDPNGQSSTTVKAEDRRLMLKQVVTGEGEIVTREFTVNVRTPFIAGGGEVHLKPRELGPPLALDWDNKLTLEFNGSHPCVDAVTITPAPHSVTLYLLGDSTVTDQPDEPWSSWGQMLPRFLKPGLAVANNAASGETLESSLHAGRLAKVLSMMRSGDYLFIQYGHNDQKEHGPGVGAYTTYAADLKYYIAETRLKGGHPVLITSMNRRFFDHQGKIVNTLGDYPAAVRLVASEEHVPLIDLNAMSETLFNVLGPEGTLKAFVHYPPNTFPNQPKALSDNSHFAPYGAYELAKCIVQGMTDAKIPITRFLKNPEFHFDPAKPDPFNSIYIPTSPATSEVKPEVS